MKSEKITISKMTGSRRFMPPPQRADKTKKGKGSYKRKDFKQILNKYLND